MITYLLELCSCGHDSAIGNIFSQRHGLGANFKVKLKKNQSDVLGVHCLAGKVAFISTVRFYPDN